MKLQQITSAQNARVKLAHKLRRRRGRDKQHRILIDGQRAVRCALDANLKLVDLFMCESALTEEDRRLLERCNDAGVELLNLAPSLLKKISYGGREDQWVATAERPSRSLANLRLPDCPIVAVLDRVEKPGNLGAVLRSADAAGVDAVILSDGLTDIFNPNAVRASLGTIFTLPIFEATTEETIAWLDAQDLQVFVARVDGSVRYDQANLTRATAVVFGNEAEGVSEAWLQPRWNGIQLPMRGQADSLNVSVSAAVVFFEARRQRG